MDNMRALYCTALHPMGNYLSKALKLCTKWDSFYLNILFHLCTFSLFFFPSFFFDKRIGENSVTSGKEKKMGSWLLAVPGRC